MIKFKHFILLFVLCFMPTYLSAQTLPTELVFFDNVPSSLTHQPLIKDDTMYAQLRDIAALLSLEVSYNPTTSEASASNGSDTFIFNTTSGTSSFNDASIFEDTPAFLLDNRTWIPIVSFADSFSFIAKDQSELFIVEYLGKETIALDYMDEPLVIDQYDYTPVNTVLINTPIAAETYTDGTFSVCIQSISSSDNQATLTFVPFTYVDYPKDYSLIGDPYLRNFSPLTLKLPTASVVDYSYLTYEPDTFSLTHTTNPSKLYDDINEGILYLATITVTNGTITAIEQLYVS
ncbi:MAG: stalk domain-containing protein [Cellulosilyticaceae bacterium]